MVISPAGAEAPRPPFEHPKAGTAAAPMAAFFKNPLRPKMFLRQFSIKFSSVYMLLWLGLPSTQIAATGRAGHRFSHAPQPMHRATSTVGIFSDFGSFGSLATICMAPVGHWRKQLSHCIPSALTMHREAVQTARPICVEAFSSEEIGSIAPAGHTLDHSTHSILQ